MKGVQDPTVFGQMDASKDLIKCQLALRATELPMASLYVLKII